MLTEIFKNTKYVFWHNDTDCIIHIHVELINIYEQTITTSNIKVILQHNSELSSYSDRIHQRCPLQVGKIGRALGIQKHRIKDSSGSGVNQGCNQ